MSDNYDSGRARERMVGFLIHNDGRGIKDDKALKSSGKKPDEKAPAGGKTFLDKVKSFSEKYEKKSHEYYEGHKDEDEDDLTDAQLKQRIRKVEAEYIKKFTDIFGTKKGRELAKGIINDLWGLTHVMPEDKPCGSGPYGVASDCCCCDNGAKENTYDYLGRLECRVATFGSAEARVMGLETSVAIKAKFGRKAANDFDSVIAKLYNTIRECTECGYDASCCLQAEVSGRIYKSLAGKTKEWLNKYLEKIDADCDAAVAVKKEEWKDWDKWGERYE